MKIILAPMEGVIDFAMREILTESGSYDHAVTEFIRVNDHLLSKSSFHKYSPELLKGGQTKSGTSVYIQLLGQHKDWMAENAYRAWEVGAPGIDLNFGCPARTVNNHKGGSILLREPDVVHGIVKAVRQAVPDAIPVTVKMRLGYEDKTLAIENALAIEEAGASSLAVHARTKLEGYKPPAHWHWIAKIAKRVKIPIIANGDIWCREDAFKCVQASGCQDIMIGRGGLSLPNLADVISKDEKPLSWQNACALIVKFAGARRDGKNANFVPNRIKQWLSYLKREYPEAEDLFGQIKKFRDQDKMITVINRNYL
ncbi:MAG: tRNA dihydrouridine(16) synthase DusC [Kordiimonadaceae bacterium]|jgi:tRNA-dihydrouridine synthase C|nr:tRNA dihydrouridine(16) synthase DusC [Kordiimonadaceae bacterium]MBT6329077.1 tRNA dihydrouridine(16) synthase DusC [Kordiimonadaceae bacterium]MBT7583874.1 tRNA dihydrouridine(16) synthase DusC [Kordiimonadaceae bacterium]